MRGRFEHLKAAGAEQEGQLVGDGRVVDAVAQPLALRRRARVHVEVEVDAQRLGRVSLVGVHAHHAVHPEPLDGDDVTSHVRVIARDAPFF